MSRPPNVAELGADERMTADRDEVKYLVPAAQVKTLATALGQYLPQHRFTGKGANPLPRPRHFVTTIYFDTPSRDQFHASIADGDHNLKMRAKEYYDLHPSLAELATDPRQIVKYQPVLWLELKFRDGTRTGKRRIGIPKTEVPAFLQSGRHHTRDDRACARRLRRRAASRCCARSPVTARATIEPLQADCLVNYRRMPWQDEAGHLRVTLDLGLEFYRAAGRPVAAQATRSCARAWARPVATVPTPCSS